MTRNIGSPVSTSDPSGARAEQARLALNRGSIHAIRSPLWFPTQRLRDATRRTARPPLSCPRREPPACARDRAGAEGNGLTMGAKVTLGFLGLSLATGWLLVSPAAAI